MKYLRRLKHAAILMLFSTITGIASGEHRPNVLWIVVEDMSCHFGYQGEPLVRTPHVDRLASEGVVFSNAYVTAPVCSASRSAMITGMYQTAIGAHNHRSSRGTEKINLPKDVRTIPGMLREAGYYTCNVNFEAGSAREFSRTGKEDYNFVYERSQLYQGTDWSRRGEGQPFFAQVQLRGGKLRHHGKAHEKAKEKLPIHVGRDLVTLPPYYPPHQVFRQDWADYLNCVQYTDYEVGQILKRLEQEQLLDETVIFFLTDHGISQARGKQFLYDEGCKVPLVAWSPKYIRESQVREDLVSHIDVAATTLALAGVQIPPTMQARSLFEKDGEQREYVVMARDRCDETVDRIRGIRLGNFKYIRNYHSERPYLQPCAYKDHKPFMAVLRNLHESGLLDRVQSLHLAEARPPEELYDLTVDRFEINNLAGDPAQADRLKEFRELLARWESESNDHGRSPEPESMYESDMKVYLDGQRRAGRQKYVADLEANIALMKQWRAEGK